MLTAIASILSRIAEILDDDEIRALLREALAARLRASIGRDHEQEKLRKALASGDVGGIESAFDDELLPADSGDSWGS